MKELSEAERGFLPNFCDMDLQGAEGALAVADGILRVSQGDDRISTDRVTDLNAPTHHGIDGVPQA